MINPAALLPGAAPRLPGAVSVLPGAASNSSSGVSSSSPASTPVGARADCEEGVSFDVPVQVTTLQSAHKVSVLLGYFCPNVLPACLSTAWISDVIRVQILCHADSSQSFSTTETPVPSSEAEVSPEVCSG